MVTVSPEDLKARATCLFRESDLPEGFEFIEWLSPLHQRLFIRDLWEALSRCAVSDSDRDLRALAELIDAWEATAKLDADPQLRDYLHSEKEYQPFEVA